MTNRKQIVVLFTLFIIAFFAENDVHGKLTVYTDPAEWQTAAGDNVQLLDFNDLPVGNWEVGTQ
ncbi:MAG: hypothetical protein KDA99_18135, partial [Planctomycetales bacterium]|nr:hypothetical protein [Planctomycetales bacterium]